ncbi:hypothetical protein ACQPXH_27835 [Nocardia sp. CA-135953]|uniref:hypothetical protein n=1 Tax=Nocardia sp. CA-135953 TaxID=3239978 RepID=UPI003D991776
MARSVCTGRHRIRGFALIETFLRPMRWDELAPLGAELFRKFRTAEGERIVLVENTFIEFDLPKGIVDLKQEDHDVCRALPHAGIAQADAGLAAGIPLEAER